MRTRLLPVLFGALFGLCILGFPELRAVGQSSPPSAPPTLTLHAQSRIVLTDVTVTDRDGNPVHGLPSSAFHIFDDNRPQQLASFKENQGASSSPHLPPAAPRGVYSNSFFQHLPPVLDVLVLDTTNLDLPDQMHLGFQLTKFVNALPRDQPLALFERHGDTAVFLQNFTADHALLLAAIRKALPRIPLTGREYRSDVDTLNQIAVDLSQIPGRKNVLWFSGGSTFYLLDGLAAVTTTAPGVSATAPSTSSAPSMTTSGENVAAMRQVYDELEAARISVYPIDARSLSAGNPTWLGAQHTQMDAIATSTGGHAFYNINDLARVAARILSTDSSSYTLTYSPLNFHYNNKWHTVRIVLKGPYHLSYRRGYFADRPHTPVPGAPRRKATVLANGSTPAAPPDLRTTPILFQANVLPATDAPPSTAGFIPLRPPTPPEKGATAFDVDYSLSTSALTAVSVDGVSCASLAFVVVAFDKDGERVGQSLDRVRFPLKPGSSPRTLKVRQQIDLRKGSTFLSLVVWDTGSGHMGMLQIPLQVSSPKVR